MKHFEIPANLVFNDPKGLTQKQLNDVMHKYGKPIPEYIQNYLTKYSGATPLISGATCEVASKGDCYFTGSYIEKISDSEELMTQLNFISYLTEMAVHFGKGQEYVEPEYLFPVASMPNGALYVATGGLHLHKIYVCDNGDCGICLYSNNLNEFYERICTQT